MTDRMCKTLLAAALLLLPAGALYAAPEPPVLVYPAPAQMKLTGGVVRIDPFSTIVVPKGDKELGWVSGLLSKELAGALNLRSLRSSVRFEVDGRLTSVPMVKPTCLIYLGTATSGKLARQKVVPLFDKLSDKKGAYVLKISPGEVAICGRDAQGVLYGALTFLQLINRTKTEKLEAACVEVVDYPYHFYRGIRSTVPRGIPRRGEITHEYYRNFLRLLGFCRVNHIWFEGCGWNIPMRRHPECGWSNILTREQAKGFTDFGKRHFISMDGSLHWPWICYGYKHLAELKEGESWDDMKKSVRRVSRVNICPSNPESWKMLFETMEDIMEVLPGDHFAVGLDEMYQEYHGSRWAVCPLCKGKNPAKLWAEMANKLLAKVLSRGKVPILGGGMLMREHQGHYKDIYKAIDMVRNRDKIVVYNWSEGAIRRGAMVRAWGGPPRPEYKIPDFKATALFKKHGYKDVVHLFAGKKWAGRPEMREMKGKLDCYGGFVSYYHAMNYEIMKQKGTLARLVFTAQHLWSPDSPAMDSEEGLKMCRYGETLADAILQGKSYFGAIRLARKVYNAPEDAVVIGEGAIGRSFASKSPPVNLLGRARGDRTEGTMTIVLPIEEANPKAAYLVLTINDWDQGGEGTIHLNGIRIPLDTTLKSNNRDLTFAPLRVPAKWLNFGPKPNVLKFVYKRTAGFIVKKASIIIVD